MNINLTLIVQMLVFIILIWFTMKFVWPMILGAMEERSKKIAQGLAAADKGEQSLAQARERAEVIVREARERATQIIDTNPVAARALLYEARDASVKALAELRDLVRGIHPPVLADRGLADAIRAMALDRPLRIEVASDLDGRLPPPVESAAVGNSRFRCGAVSP